VEEGEEERGKKSEDDAGVLVEGHGEGEEREEEEEFEREEEEEEVEEVEEEVEEEEEVKSKPRSVMRESGTLLWRRLKETKW